MAMTASAAACGVVMPRATPPTSLLWIAAAILTATGPPSSAYLGEPGRDDAHCPHAENAGLVHHVGHRRCGHRHHRQVRPRRTGDQVRVGGHPPDDLVASVDRVHRAGVPALEQVGQQQPADAVGLVARTHQGNGRGAQKRPDLDAGRCALIGQYRVQVGVGFLHGEAGVHGSRRDLLGVFQAQILQQAEDRHIVLAGVAGQPPYPGVPGGFGQLAQQQGAQPGAPPGGVDEEQEPRRVSARALIPGYTRHPPGRGDRDERRRVARPRGRATSPARSGGK
jgi:hypothetical protein